MSQCWWLYLLACRDGRTYIGIATDVAARFELHSRGKGAKFTRSNPPVRILGTRAYATKSEALKAEAALKKLDRTAKLAWARLHGPDTTEGNSPPPGSISDRPARDVITAAQASK